MKKICALLAVLLLGFVFVGCDKLPNDEPTTPEVPVDPVDKTTPSITLPNNAIEVNVGDKLDLLAGVSAIGYENNDLTAEIKVNHAIPVDANGCVTTAGTYNVRYSLTINNVAVAQVFRTVTVIYVRPDTDDIIANGDFETGSVDPYTLGLFDGGNAKLSVVKKDGNNALKVEITGVSWQQASPRVEQTIKLDASKIYELSFKAAADEARTMHVQFGQLLAADPWFLDVDPTARYFDLTTSMAEYSFRFKPSSVSGADMTQLSVLFELGTMTKTGAISAQTNVYLDDIKIVEVDSLGADVTAPTISITGKSKYYVGEAFDAAACASVTDDQDENPTITVVEAESKLPQLTDGKLTAAGSYKVVYEAADATGNTAKAEYTFEVVEPQSAGSELIVNNDFSKGNDTGFEGWLSWAEAAIYGTAADGKATLNVNNSQAETNYAQQFVQHNVPIQEGKTYVVKFVLKASVDRKVVFGFQNNGLWNFHVQDTIELKANTEYVYEKEFTAVAPSDDVLFFLGLGNVDGVCPDTHTIEISGVSLKEKEGETPTPTPTPNPGEEIKQPELDPNKLFGTPNAEVANGSGPGAQANITLINKFHVWFNDWEGSVVESSMVDGKLVLNCTALNPGEMAGWYVQIFYRLNKLEEGNYTLSFKFNSAQAGQLKVCGNMVNVVEGENSISVNIPVGTANYDILIMFADGTNPTITTVGEYTFSDFNLVKAGETPAPTPTPTPTPSNKLPQVVGLVINDIPDRPGFYVVAFAPVDGAKGYEVVIVKDGAEQAPVVVDTNACTVELTAGTYTAKVRALADDAANNGEWGVSPEKSIGGATPTPTPTPSNKLAQVVGLVINDIPDRPGFYVVAFAPVDGAKRYEVILIKDGVEQAPVVVETNACTVELPNGTYTAKVRALADDAANNGEWGVSEQRIITNSPVKDEPVNPSKLAQVVGLVINDIPDRPGFYVVAFAPVDGAKGYEVVIVKDGAEQAPVVVETNACTVELTAGTYTAKVRALADDAANNGEWGVSEQRIIAGSSN